MVQPARFLSQDNQTDMEITVFLEYSETWSTMEFQDMVWSVPHGSDNKIIKEKAKAVIEEPRPRPEKPLTGETEYHVWTIQILE